MQLLHGACNIQNNMEYFELKKTWENHSSKKFETLPALIITRWWTGGIADSFVKENWNTLTELFAGLINANLANTPVN